MPMKRFVVIAFTLVVLLSGCMNQFNKVYKLTDQAYRYEYAKELYARGKYQGAITLLEDLVVVLKGGEFAEESMFLLGMAEYYAKDYETAATYFRKYTTSYPRGTYAELAAFYAGESRFQGTPEPRLDQTLTVQAIAAFQEYLDLFPDGKHRKEAHQRLIALQEKLVKKELLNAELYYNLGTYFGNCTSGGNNYDACIVTAQNAIKDYPYSDLREQFSVLIMKSKFKLAESSVEAKKIERYRDAEDECYGFLNQYPDSEQRKTAEKYIEACKKFTKE